MRDDTIPLPADEARCSSGGGLAANRCARHRASIPPMGALKDWAAQGTGCNPLCPGFLDVGQVRRAAVQQKPRVWPPMGQR